MTRNIIIAITGASGAIYAARTLSALLERGCQIDLVVSDYGRRLLRDELGDAAAVDKLMDYLSATYGDGVRTAATRFTAIKTSAPRLRAAARTATRWYRAVLDEDAGRRRARALAQPGRACG